LGNPSNEDALTPALGVIGVIAAFLVPPAGLVLGLLGRRQAREQSRSRTLSTVAAVVGGLFTGIGLVVVIAGIVIAVTGAGAAQTAQTKAAFCDTAITNSKVFSDVAAMGSSPDNTAEGFSYY
jgi:hypothetical protein